jgi:plastocyanin
MIASLATLSALAARVNGQTAVPSGPHVIVVRLIEKTGPTPYAFDPANTQAQRGDTIRFTEAAGTLHNVRFTKQAPGAKLGAVAVGPYLSTKGQTYDVVIDKRFTDGTYEYVCDPHAAIGMKGTLVVKGGTVVAASAK